MEINKKVQMLCETLDNKKALNVSVIDIRNASALADYFIIATSTSDTHARTLCDEIELACKKSGESIYKADTGSGEWMAIDLGDIIIHIFNAKMREHLNIEKLWSSGKNIINFDMLLKIKEKPAGGKAAKTEKPKPVKEIKPKAVKEIKEKPVKEIKAKPAKTADKTTVKNK